MPKREDEKERPIIVTDDDELRAAKEADMVVKETTK